MKNRFNYLLTGMLLGSLAIFSGCSDDDAPAIENPEEEITRVTLIFTPTSGNPVTAVWFDEDGEEGPIEATKDEINLAANTEYTLAITLENTLATEAEEQNITAEVLEEADEHMFFFSFSEGVFTSPLGDGNFGAENRNDPMNYLDTDGTNPIGLLTQWTTGDPGAIGGNFTVLLKHQPALEEGGTPQKSSISTSDTGDTDIDIPFVLNVL